MFEPVAIINPIQFFSRVGTVEGVVAGAGSGRIYSFTQGVISVPGGTSGGPLIPQLKRKRRGRSGLKFNG
jgi:hypothetical protein